MSRSGGLASPDAATRRDTRQEDPGINRPMGIGRESLTPSRTEINEYRSGDIERRGWETTTAELTLTLGPEGVPTGLQLPIKFLFSREGGSVLDTPASRISRALTGEGAWRAELTADSDSGVVSIALRANAGKKALVEICRGPQGGWAICGAEVGDSTGMQRLPAAQLAQKLAAFQALGFEGLLDIPATPRSDRVVGAWTTANEDTDPTPRYYR